MKTLAALLCLMFATNATAGDKQPQTEQASRPDLILNQQQSIVSTELVLIRLKEPAPETVEAEVTVPPLVPPMTLLWNHSQVSPQVRHPFILIKKENIKKNP